jgi:organic radical activating enzyme
MLTYKCTIACPHCIVEAGPHRTTEIELERALDWIEQISAYRDGHIKGVALTGGEPFYNLELLARISARSEQLGLIVSVVSNAYWAESRQAALDTLSSVPGLRLVSFSTDAYHQKSIPFRNIGNAVWAAKRLGKRYNIAVCTDNEDDPVYQRILEDLASLGEADNLRLSITFPVGRAQTAARRFNYATGAEPVISACSMAGSPVIFPDGRVVGCIGPVFTLTRPHPLLLGNLHFEPLDQILDRSEVNPVLHAIRVWGPHKLVGLLREEGLDDLLPDDYLRDCVCDPCFKLLSEERVVRALEGLYRDESKRQTLAYARLYYLNEAAMVERWVGKHPPEAPGARELHAASS